MHDILLSLGNITARTLGSIVLIFILAKITGPRQIAQLTFYDYIVGITIGSIAAEMAFVKEIPFYIPIWAMILYSASTILMAYCTNKSITLRKIFTGKPEIMIYQGKIIERNLKRNHYDINDLLCECRNKGYFNLSDIEYAIFETNGQISFMPKESKRPVVMKDITVPNTQDTLVSNVIMDGHIMQANLGNTGKDESWLRKELMGKGYKTINNILLATMDGNEQIAVFLKNEPLNNENYFI